MREIIIDSWDDLQRAVFDGVWDEKIMRYRANRAYRGASDSNWLLTPSLNRICAHDLSLETSVIRSFRKYAYADLVDYDSIWQILPLAQHHGLPTRLLDWTYSPLVAAHFATDDITMYDRDGAIWLVDVEAVNARLPSKLRALLASTRSQIFSVEMLENIAPALDSLKDFGGDFALFFEPASMLDRIANQYALFSVTSDPAVTFGDLFFQDDCCQKLVIRREAKLEIRDKLDYINISERMIYPGLDGICRWITRQYSALGPIHNARNQN
ncbi:MAG: FRG domain-containing protein [Christensenellales bacterium]|jgi:hypothetical protein